MKRDLYNHKEKYFCWKKEVITNGMSQVSDTNSKIIQQYIFDMEKGYNIAKGSIKGPRSYSRLNTLRDQMIFYCKKFKEIYDLDDITQISEEQVIGFFSDIRRGNIRTMRGGKFKSLDTITKIFKAFWHWHQKVNRRQGNEIKDITIDLDTRRDKPKWVYLTEAQIKQMCGGAKYYYRVLIWFLLDTGIRAPTELMNIQVRDFYSDFKELNIRDEVSKTFGRRIKLMLCADLIKEYVKNENLKDTDYLFNINPASMNKYLKRRAVKLFGTGETDAGGKYSEISLYDFRHCSCCYWLPRYKSESALKYRFGWKKSDKIHYYSELLGMRDTINEDDMLVDVTRTELEQEQQKLKRENKILNEKMVLIEKKMGYVLELVKGVEFSVVE